jgi:hypothetical protein
MTVYYQRHKEVIKAKARARRNANKDETNKKLRERYRNDEKYRNRCRSLDLHKKYGITLDFYNYMFSKQDGKCAICRSEDIGRKNGLHFLVDHDHKTKQVRGLLCHRCNLMLGSANDQTETLHRAIIYLENARREARIDQK